MPFSHVHRWCLWLSALAVLRVGIAHAQHKLGPQVAFEAPKIAGASDEGERAIKRFQLPSGWKAELWAGEPDVAHGVAFDLADDGRVFVVESFRAWRGVPDIRGIMSWLDEDLACRSVEDRLAMMQRHLGEEGMKDYYKNTERIRLLTDPLGAGKATKSVVFADNFATPLDGVASGVLARGKDVYFANIPNLWLLRDDNLDGVADDRQSLSYGHGVRVGFLGHDLHGLVFGPDGKLYFSIGDRASMIRQNGVTIGNPDTGAVFRCNPDGSELELFYLGLRNPQELVFDEWGNLFTGDNNSDGGDQARWTYLIEGGDSGWRIGWQFLEQPNPRGPWNSEKMWQPQNDAQPAYITPPITNITAGPSGVAYYPGTGLGSDWQGTFTLCDFRGSATGSGIWSFKQKPKGASFEIIDAKRLIWSVEATDGAWGPDGAYWVLDWVDGWEPVGKGRIYRMYDPASLDQPLVRETRQLLREGFGQRSDSELLQLLGHANYRVRLNAQFELAARGDLNVAKLGQLAQSGGSLHVRLHALWALGNIAHRAHRTGQGDAIAALSPVLQLLGDPESHLRANAARVLGDAKEQRAYDGLVKLTTDSDAHVRALAAMALGKLGRREAVPVLFAMLQSNADVDPFLRHAAVQGLVTLKDFDALEAAIKHPNASVRLGVVVAMRRLERSEISEFVRDANPRVVTEAARAINDVPIPGALETLASLLRGPRPSNNDPLNRRIINANYRFGTRDTADTLATFAGDEAGAEHLRAEALEALAAWPKNSGRDRITGLWRPTAFTRDTKIPADALRPVVNRLLAAAPNSVRAAAATAAGELKISEASEALANLVRQQQGNGPARSAALRSLSQLRSPEYASALTAAHNDPDEGVRKLALKLSVDVPPVVTSATTGAVSADPTPRLAEVIAHGSLAEKQNALAALGQVKSPAAVSLLTTWLNDLLAGKVQPELQLDVLEAGSKQPALKSLVERWTTENSVAGDHGIEPWRVSLSGGDVEEGKKVFLERAEVSCVRCHKISGEGGEVGPELAGLVAKKGREYVLRSIVHPNSEIAAGFDSALVTLKNGTTYAGVIKSETPETLEINSPEEGLVSVKKSEIESREKGLSGMPEGFGELLSKQDLRNLIEYLASAN